MPILTHHPNYILMYKPDMKLIGHGGNLCDHTHEMEDVVNDTEQASDSPSEGKAREDLGHTLWPKLNFGTTLESQRAWTVGPGGLGLNPGSATY